MSFYFHLQFSRIMRYIQHLGFQPYIGILLVVVGFYSLSLLLFYKTSLAIYIYTFIAVAGLLQFSSKERNRFIGICFSKKTYRQIRILEYSFLTIPFVIFLVYKLQFLVAGCLLFSALFLAFIRPIHSSNLVVKTPFYKHPFEFLRGFRISFPLFLVLIILVTIGIYVKNFNLAAFTILVAVMTSMSFYSEIESPYFVWIYNYKSKDFLFYKIKTSIHYISLLLIPFIIALAFFYTDKIFLLIIFWMVACLYMTTTIVAKYAIYPKQINLPMAIILAVGYLFPPLLLLYIPFLFKKSIVQLDKILT